LASKTKAKTTAGAKAAVADKRRRRRKGKNTLYYFMALFVCLAAGLILSFTVFFRLDDIAVTGNTLYSNEELLASSGIRVGDNMFRVVGKEVNARLTAAYPFIEQIRIRRKLPTALTIEVTMAQPAAVLPTEGEALLVNEKGRVLALTSPQEYPDFSRIEGYTAPQLKVMDILDDTAQKQLAQILKITDTLKKAEIEGIKLISLADPNNLRLLYDDRLIINLGSQQEMQYKLDFVKHAIDKSVDESFVGSLDVSTPPFARLRAINIYTEEFWCFSRGYLEEILPYITPPTAPETEEILEGEEGQAASSQPLAEQSASQAGQ